MKHLSYVSVFLVFCLLLCGCTDSQQKEKILIRAEINGWGKNVVLETDEELTKLKNILDDIEYTVVAKRTDSLAPGSITTTIRMEYSNEETDVISLPCNVVGEEIYKAPDEITKVLFDTYFSEFFTEAAE
ncbi:MAG: hypothetical protein IKL10_06190 [Clostridia bacterium]|nr:hypothetical protein [Clostridia bacterium]